MVLLGTVEAQLELSWGTKWKNLGHSWGVKLLGSWGTVEAKPVGAQLRYTWGTISGKKREK